MTQDTGQATASSRTLAPHTVRAYNFATESENKIHDNDVAAKLGFTGGLVPGVALYAYMTVPMARDFGAEWIARGTMSAKFIQPIYDGEAATVRATVESETPLRVKLELFNPTGTLCAVGTAGMLEQTPPVDPARYPHRPMPTTRFEPRVHAIPSGTKLGSLKIDRLRPAHAQPPTTILDELLEKLPMYSSTNAPWHPALLPVRANRLLAENVALGPWIHTASETTHYALPNASEEIWLRGFVAESFVKRGHDMVTLDLVAFGENDRVLARILHTAIIRPAQLG
jgi:hypothetical protein